MMACAITLRNHLKRVRNRRHRHKVCASGVDRWASAAWQEWFGAEECARAREGSAMILPDLAAHVEG